MVTVPLRTQSIQGVARARLYDGYAVIHLLSYPFNEGTQEVSFPKLDNFHILLIL
jgi:hypothetical protein